METTSRSSCPIPRLSYLLPLFLALLQCPPLLQASVEDDLRANRYISKLCSTSAYGLSPNYGPNLEQLFRSLVDSVPSRGYYNNSVGETPYTAYGLALCRGDVPPDICRNCTAVAVERVKVECPNNRSAMIWFDPCFLRFSDQVFFGDLDPTDRIMWKDPNSSTATVSAGVDAQALIYPLVKAAASDPKRFATKIEPQDGYVSYGLAQCTRDLTAASCTVCFQYAIAEIAKNSSLGQGWRFLSRSCIIAFLSNLMGAVIATSVRTSTAVESPPGQLACSIALLYNRFDLGGKSGNQRRTVIVICSTVGFLLLAVGFSVLLFRSRKRKELNGEFHSSTSQEQILSYWLHMTLYVRFVSFPLVAEELRRYSNEMGSLGNLNEDERNHELPHHSLKAVQAATNNFSEENKLGRGGFGPVYKGELSGRIVAVKRLSERSGQGLKEFMNEVILIAKLQHKNLVHPEKRKALDWEKRFNIIMGSARGILYLHQDSLAQHYSSGS
ncbi:Cysteine-rich repeat secretory protein 38 [Nymphaea thermarum]|nr:Cysteine-rich repeat secretory protein 38 [Nymphaea thermarum]